MRVVEEEKNNIKKKKKGARLSRRLHTDSENGTGQSARRGWEHVLTLHDDEHIRGWSAGAAGVMRAPPLNCDSSEMTAALRRTGWSLQLLGDKRV